MPRLSSNTRKFGQFWTPSPNIGIESSCEIDTQYLLPKDFCTLCDLYMNKRWVVSQGLCSNTGLSTLRVTRRAVMLEYWCSLSMWRCFWADSVVRIAWIFLWELLFSSTLFQTAPAPERGLVGHTCSSFVAGRVVLVLGKYCWPAELA